MKDQDIKIQYQTENNLNPTEFKEVLVNSSLGERRPVNDMDRLSGMIKNANLVISARYEGRLVGIARSVTDFEYCTYLSDLAVDAAFQKQGIGKELIRRTKQATPNAKLILLSAPKAISYYPAIGMKQHPNCYYIDSEDELR